MSKLPTSLAIEVFRPPIFISLYGTSPKVLVKNDRDRPRKTVQEPRGFFVDAALIEVLKIETSSAATYSNTLPVHMCLPASGRPEQNTAVS